MKKIVNRGTMIPLLVSNDIGHIIVTIVWESLFHGLLGFKTQAMIQNL